MNIRSCIDRQVFLEAQSVAEFRTGGWTPNVKTKKAKMRFLNKMFDGMKIKKLTTNQVPQEERINFN